MPTVSIGPDSADLFDEILSILCRDTKAVTITPRDGEPFGVVLASCSGDTLVYEGWDEEAGVSSGEPRTIGVEEIAEVRVV